MMKPVTVYYRPSCALSVGVLGFLAVRGASFVVMNLDRNPELARGLEQRLGPGKLATPTLEVEERLYVAPEISKLKEYLQEWGLPDDSRPGAEGAED